jgi:putative methionine-R-sulfoxide reductase with GAF domain
LESAQSDDRKALLLSNYLRDRMGEAKSFLADSAESNVRIALWIYDPASDKLAFYFSNEVRPTQASWEPGEGLIGQAWLESRRFNEPDVRSVPGYKATRNEDPPYKAVICVPVRRGYDTIGMLTADKDEDTIFSEVADDVATGLAAQCAFALDQYGKLA